MSQGYTSISTYNNGASGFNAIRGGTGIVKVGAYTNDGVSTIGLLDLSGYTSISTYNNGASGFNAIRGGTGIVKVGAYTNDGVSTIGLL